jgi:hypothetical protein
MNELRAFSVAAEDIRVGAIPKGDNSCQPASAQLSSNEELTCIPSTDLVFEIYFHLLCASA